MCTAAIEGEAAPGPFSASIPHNAHFYAFAGVTYLFALKWQAADRSLAKEIAAHKAAHATEEPAVRSSRPLPLNSSSSLPADFVVCSDAHRSLRRLHLPWRLHLL